MRRSVVVLLALTLVTVTAAYSPVRCPPGALTDSYTGHRPQLAASATAPLAVHTLHGIVTVLSTATNTSTIVTVASPSPCFTANISGTNHAMSPWYGYSVAMAHSVAAISAPNRDTSAAVSFIDIVSVSDSASAGVSVSDRQTIYADDSPYLGLFLALSDDSEFLVAYHTDATMIVYCPVMDRAVNTFNIDSDSDTLIEFPMTFYSENAIVSDSGSVFVGGYQVTTSSSVPMIVVYESVANEWVISASVLLTRVSPVFALVNSLSLARSLALPSQSVSLAATEETIVVGVTAINTVFIVNVSNHDSVRYVTSDTNIAEFGLSVLVREGNEALLVISEHGLVSLPISAFINASATNSVTTVVTTNILPLLSSVVPNRQQYLPGENENSASTVYYDVAFSSASNTTLMLSNRFLLTMPDIPTGQSLQYDYWQQQFVHCPEGTFREVDSDEPSYTPCSFCPVNSYSSVSGATECSECSEEDYCPSGAVHPYHYEWLTETSESSIPEFESEDFAQSFEDLLIHGIFAPKAPLMIVAYSVASATFVLVLLYIISRRLRPYAMRALSVYRFALQPTEEEAELKNRELRELIEEELDDQHRRHGIDLNTLGTLARSYSNASATSAGAKPDNDHGNANSEELPNANPEMMSVGSLRRARAHAADSVSQMEENTMKGFFNILLLLFAISAILFSVTYVNNYQPGELGTDESNNRYRAESLVSTTVTDEMLVAGLDAINAVNASINIHLVGYSGFTCDRHSQIALGMEGCVVMDTNSQCNETQYWELYENEEIPHTCTMTLALVQNTYLSNTATLSLQLPSSAMVSALRLEFLQYSQDTDPDDHISTGTTEWFETVTHPIIDGSVIPNGLAPVIERNWIFGIVARATQYDEGDPPPFSYVWYNTVTSADSPTQFLPTYPLTGYQLSQSATTIIKLTMVTETVFRLQKVQKLIQLRAAFLTILLGLIAIFHIVEFGKQCVELVLLLVKRVRKNRAVKSVTDMTQDGVKMMVGMSKAAVKQVYSPYFGHRSAVVQPSPKQHQLLTPPMQHSYSENQLNQAHQPQQPLSQPVLQHHANSAPVTGQSHSGVEMSERPPAHESLSRSQPVAAPPSLYGGGSDVQPAVSSLSVNHPNFIPGSHARPLPPLKLSTRMASEPHIDSAGSEQGQPEAAI